MATKWIATEKIIRLLRIVTTPNRDETHRHYNEQGSTEPRTKFHHAMATTSEMMDGTVSTDDAMDGGPRLEGHCISVR